MKLVFLRHGKLFEYYQLNNKYKTDILDIDEIISLAGYNFAVKELNKAKHEYVFTANPAILNAKNEHSDPIWWQNNKWEIYFVVKNELVNIQEFTDKELRMAHNIENLYLNGGLNND